MNGLFMTVVGIVGTEPRQGQWQGTPVLSFRLVSKERRWDKRSQSWVDGHPSWVSISCFRELARNVFASISKGDLLIVHGKVRVKDYVSAAGQPRTVVDIEADSVGHDLRFGTTRFRPAERPQNTDDRLREEADAIVRELAELPEESVDQILAERAARAGTQPDPDDDDELVDAVTGELLDSGDELDDLDDEEEDEEEDDLDDEEDEGDRRTPVGVLAASGQR